MSSVLFNYNCAENRATLVPRLFAVSWNSDAVKSAKQEA